MSFKIINANSLVQDRLKNGYSRKAIIFRGDRHMNLEDAEPLKRFEKIVKMKSANWNDSYEKAVLWDQIEKEQKILKNAAQAPSVATLEALLGKVFLDITRRAMEAPDLTSRIATEITNLRFAETVNLREIYKYIGDFKDIKGNNDSVPLIEQKFGETDSVTMVTRGLGWKTTLKNLLYNSLHSMDKVLQAVVDADTDKRNEKTVGTIIGATYVASQKQAADATSGATYDTLIYNTLRKAIKKLRALKDYRTGRTIAVPRISLLCNPSDTWSVARVISGQLQSGGTTGVLTTQNVSALPIDEIIEYDQGINNGYTYGKEELSYPGVTAGKCYIFVPREYFWVLNKRPLTMETGRGSVLQLSQEERAWYRVQTEFYKIFLGSSYHATALGASYGAIIEVTLPTDS